jgi:BirA family transcriptional regulator, biotin operon repressor / biotin---[acetyl-CoA-carboxylase] ligase
MRFSLIRHDCVDSTQERAFAALAQGSARHGDVHLAREQRAGRGRRGNTWLSARDQGVWLSCVLLPPPPPLSPAALTMAGGLAAYGAARALLGPSAALRIKWPNDVLLQDAKLAGVLVETRGLDPLKPHYVLGIGLNVQRGEFPSELRAVSLGCADLASAEQALLASLASELERLLAHEPTLCARFTAALGFCGQRVQVKLSAQTLEGRLLELSLERGLVLEGQAALPLELVQGVSAV